MDQSTGSILVQNNSKLYNLFNLHKLVRKCVRDDLVEVGIFSWYRTHFAHQHFLRLIN